MIERKYHKYNLISYYNLGDNMKLVYKIIKSICLGIITIYSFNVLFKLINVIIPINIFTIAISAILGVSGNFALVLLQVIMM